MTTLPKSRRLYTEAEYLALERESEERHEYLDQTQNSEIIEVVLSAFFS